MMMLLLFLFFNVYYMYLHDYVYDYSMNRKGANGVSTNGVTANFMCLTEGPFGYSR